MAPESLAAPPSAWPCHLPRGGEQPRTWGGANMNKRVHFQPWEAVPGIFSLFPFLGHKWPGFGGTQVVPGTKSRASTCKTGSQA